VPGPLEPPAERADSLVITLLPRQWTAPGKEVTDPRAIVPPGRKIRWSAASRQVVATLGLVFVVFGLLRAGRAPAVPYAVGAYIAAAILFTSSTSFANPAATIARSLSNTFAGIAPASVPMFVLAELAGALLGLGVVVLLYPRRGAETR
jgi:glycerol uptake facilitator-like aquaporin